MPLKLDQSSVLFHLKGSDASTAAGPTFSRLLPALCKRMCSRLRPDLYVLPLLATPHLPGEQLCKFPTISK